jgi:hypothetical protein
VLAVKVLSTVTLPLVLAACWDNGSADREAAFRARPHIQASAELIECANLVDRYVASSKRWANADYKVALERVESNATLFRVSHVDDTRGDPSIRGAGTSIFVEADCGSGRILHELRMQ